eukprot:TRINITY_DN14346_c0_g1_i1.p2 TRINITY_DN14346_c0_g1~~TRINITY_DN14346_c0_g1_i1.p2  ORF type:complete len:332 (+),score=131.65 TRINITY_DN14346_c0_g1_i1:100-996(+)
MGDAKEVGFIGLGIMGLGMARNLARKGRKLVVWNRDGEKATKFAAEFPGAVTVSGTAREVTARCGVTFSMLSTPEAARAVWEGADGALAGLGKGHDIVDSATLTAQDMQRMAAQAVEKGARFVEAPVSGSKAPAEQGQLIFLAAGDGSLYQEVGEELDMMGKAKFFLGDVGKGTQLKLAVNMIMGTMMGALSEGMALTGAAGIDTAQLLAVLDLGAMANPMFKLKGAAMSKALAEGAPCAPAFPLKHAQKDMEFARRLGEETGTRLPVATAANDVFKEALAEHGDEDFSAVVKRYRRE